MAEGIVRRLLSTFGFIAVAVVTAVIFLFVSIYPYIELLRTSLSDDAGRLTGANWTGAFAAQYLLLTPLLHSMSVGIGTALTATALGALLAWFSVRTDLPGARAVLPFVAIPHIIPGFQLASAWVLIFTRGGLWDTMLLGRAPVPPYGGIAIWLVLTLHLYIFSFMASAGVLSTLDSSLEEAARVAGLRPWRVLARVTLPLMVPAMLSGLLLCFAYAMEEFGAPSLLGAPTGYSTLTTSIYELATTPPLSFGSASVLSIVLGAVAVLVLIGNLRLAARTRIAMISGKASGRGKFALGRWRWPLTAVVWIFLLATSFGPLAALALTSFLDTWGHGYGPGNWTLARHAALISNPELAQAVLNTFGMAVIAAAAATLVGVVTAYGHIRLRARWAAAMDRISFLSFATPGLVIGVALTLAFGGGLINLYGTYAILVIAYIVRFSGIAVRSVSTDLARIGPDLEAAGRIAGLPPARVIARITLPIAREGIVAGFLLAFINCVKEISATSLLVSQGHETLAYEAYLRFQEGNYTQGSAVSLWMIALSLAITALAARRGGKESREILT
ncbi:MAG TPA: iron ABC transporter permease [Nitrobacter sp.]|nr:iron ABC transporter permease [Nitrobacter sp.]